MREKLNEAIRAIESAEKMAPVGSHEQCELVKAALYSAWPIIRAYLEYEERTSAAS